MTATVRVRAPQLFGHPTKKLSAIPIDCNCPKAEGSCPSSSVGLQFFSKYQPSATYALLQKSILRISVQHISKNDCQSTLSCFWDCLLTARAAKTSPPEEGLPRMSQEPYESHHVTNDALTIAHSSTEKRFC